MTLDLKFDWKNHWNWKSHFRHFTRSRNAMFAL